MQAIILHISINPCKLDPTLLCIESAYRSCCNGFWFFKQEWSSRSCTWEGYVIWWSALWPHAVSASEWQFWTLKWQFASIMFVKLPVELSLELEVSTIGPSSLQCINCLSRNSLFRALYLSVEQGKCSDVGSQELSFMESLLCSILLALAAKPGRLNDREKISEHGCINASVAFLLF